MTFVLLHDRNGDGVLVDFAHILYACKEKYGSHAVTELYTLSGKDEVTLYVTETPEEIYKLICKAVGIYECT